MGDASSESCSSGDGSNEAKTSTLPEMWVWVGLIGLGCLLQQGSVPLDCIWMAEVGAPPLAPPSFGVFILLGVSRVAGSAIIRCSGVRSASHSAAVVRLPSLPLPMLVPVPVIVLVIVQVVLVNEVVC